jgi:hypothetical protein
MPYPLFAAIAPTECWVESYPHLGENGLDLILLPGRQPGRQSAALNIDINADLYSCPLPHRPAGRAQLVAIKGQNVTVADQARRFVFNLLTMRFDDHDAQRCVREFSQR